MPAPEDLQTIAGSSGRRSRSLVILAVTTASGFLIVLAFSLLFLMNVGGVRDALLGVLPRSKVSQEQRAPRAESGSTKQEEYQNPFAGNQPAATASGTYQNPFGAEENYTNPFENMGEEYVNPFENL